LWLRSAVSAEAVCCPVGAEGLSVPAEHDFPEGRGGVGLHAGEDVLVDLHGEGDAGVAEAFADDLDRHPLLDEECGMRVPEIMQSDPGNVELGEEPVEGLGEVVGVDR